MAPAIPALNSLWRPGLVGPAPLTRDDRELIRQYAGQPASGVALFSLTVRMNDLARDSPATVPVIQAWINQSEDLEEAWAAKVEDGTAHLGNMSSYEGPRPGKELTRADLKNKLDVIEWDTSLLRVKTDTGGNFGATEGQVVAQRIALLRTRILAALGIETFDDSQLVRS
jgi:hypothetical protein